MFDALHFLKDYKIQHWSEGKNVSPGWVNINCPLCRDDSNHGGFNIAGSYYNCWKCGRHDIKWIMSKLIRISLKQAEGIVWEYSTHNVQIKQLNRKKGKADKIILPGSEMNKFHRKYLKKRNFDPDEIQSEYSILGTGPGEKWNGKLFELRIIIPIIYQNKVISFQGRDITNKQNERYKGCPVEMSILNYKDILYNIDMCNGDKIIVLEGVMDVWRMGKGFVASFGTTITSLQLELLSHYNEIYFLFDPETEAQSLARGYAQQLASMGKVTEVLKLDMEKDPANLTEKEAEYLRKELL